MARQPRAGRICFNATATNSLTPTGEYKQSGIGRPMGVFGLEEYLEIKSVYGFGEKAESLPELPHQGLSFSDESQTRLVCQVSLRALSAAVSASVISVRIWQAKA